MSRILVLGGAGAVGSAAVRDLVKNDDISQIVVGDIAFEKARTHFKKLKKVAARRVDVTDFQALVASMKGFDGIVNCTWFEYNMNVTAAAIKAGVNMVDLGGLFHVTRKQLELNQDAVNQEVTVVPGCGGDTGITNLMARYAADRLDDVDYIKIRDGDRDLESQPALFKFSIRTIVDEWRLNAIVFRNGEFIEVPPLSQSERVEFPPPVGSLDTYLVIHSEVATLPMYIGKGVKDVDFMVSEPIDMIRTLKALGLLSDVPIEVRGQEVRPREITTTVLASHQAGHVEGEPGKDATCILVQVGGEKGGKKMVHELHCLAVQKEKWGVCAVDYLTGVGASVGIQLILDGKAKSTGVVPPEAAFPPEEFLDQIARREAELGHRTCVPLP